MLAARITKDFLRAAVGGITPGAAKAKFLMS